MTEQWCAALVRCFAAYIKVIEYDSFTTVKWIKVLGSYPGPRLTDGDPT